MHWTRRDLLKLLSCLPLTGIASADVATLVVTDGGDYEAAFAPIKADLRALERMGRGVPEDQRLRNGRTFLGGNADFQSVLSELGRWIKIPGPGGDIPLRVLTPPGGEPRGVLLSIHGGGWAMGAATSDEKFNAEFARQCGCVVVSPEYRLAPEHPYPAGPDDCEAVARWLVKNSEREFGTRVLAVGGSSAGGHLAATTLLRLKPEELRQFCCAVLFYGVYDLSRVSVWRERNDEDHPDLTPSGMELYVKWFLPGTDDPIRREPCYSPLYATLPTLPPALFLIGSADLLAHDSEAFSREWSKVGPAELMVYKGAPHGFNGYPVTFDPDPNAYARSFLRRHLNPGTRT
jgi:acetyl esterase/lipase